MIIKSPNHDHFWTEDNVVYESYNTIRGLRYTKIIELDFNYPNHDNLTDNMLEFINNILQSQI